MQLKIFRRSKTSVPVQTSALRLTLAVCVAGLIASPVLSQDGRFENPTLEAAKTIGGSQFGGDQVEGLEDITGEVISQDSGSGRARLSQPDFGSFGPVGDFQSGDRSGGDPGQLSIPTGSSNSDASTSDSSTPVRPGEVLSRTPSLPNRYQSESFFPDWINNDSDSAASPNPPPASVLQSQPERRVVPQLDTPRLQIDGMKAIEQANQQFDSSTHEIIRERYPDGSIKIVRTIAQDSEGNYYNDGGWLMYDTEQRPIASGTFVRGAMEGDWERVHETGNGLFSQVPFSLFNGPYISRANFVRNEIDGVWKISDKQGKLISSVTYQDGVRTGLASWFFPSGKKMREATFKDGIPNGIVLQWDQQGKLQKREQFVDGRRVIRKRSTYPNQQLAAERVFRDRKLSPQGADNWWAAKPATFEQSGEAIQYGPVAEWYPNRQPKMTGRYVEGERDGLFTWWHKTHNKKAEGNFSRGKRTGLWRYWHESGMKRSEGRFEDDRPVGVWRSWNVDGRIIEEKDFSSNVPEYPLEPEAGDSIFENESGVELPTDDDDDAFEDPSDDASDRPDPFGERFERGDPRAAVPLGFRSLE